MATNDQDLPDKNSNKTNARPRAPWKKPAKTGPDPSANEVEVLISEADQHRIQQRREQESQEESKRVAELEENYAEYNNYMRMIGKMLGIDESDMASDPQGPDHPAEKR